jgi:hypothetical protein
MARRYYARRAHADSYAHDRTNWKAAVWAALIAGLVFMMAEMIMVLTFLGQSPWGPPRMIAAMLMGQEVLPPPATFDGGVMMTAMMIHFPLSIVYGLVIGWIVHRLTGKYVTLIGAVFGLAIYFINFYLVAPILFPWFTEAQNMVSLLAHFLYGVVLGGSYAGLRHHKPVGE